MANYKNLYWERDIREAKLRWLEHAQRRDGEYIGERVLTMEQPGRSNRERPQRSGLAERDGVKASDRMKWRHCGESSREKKNVIEM